MECLFFGGGPSVWVAYTDSDMTGDIDYKKSTARHLVTFAWRNSFMAIQVAKVCRIIPYGGRIHCYY